MSSNFNDENRQSGVIAWFVKNPVAANLLMVVILFAGIATAMGLRIEGFPSTDPSRITIDVAYESGDVRQAEEGIAVKIEEALLGTKGIKTISSTSTGKGVTVQVERQFDYDLDRLNADIKNKVDGIYSFPAAAEKPVVSQQQWQESGLWISVYGDVDQKRLQQVARQFENALLALPSVNKISRSGWLTPEIAIEVDESTLQAHNLTLDELAQRIRAESLSETSGELRSSDGIILLKADKQRYFWQDFANVVVATHPDGTRLYLADIAKITDGFAETPKVLSRFQGKTAINLEVLVDRDANIVALSEQAGELVAQWQQGGRLPAQIGIDLWMDQSVGMLERLTLVVENGLIGILLVMVVLTIFLHHRVAFWVGMGLPVCFAGGLLMMGSGFFDLTLNQLTTFGFVLVLGILVDDAVVVGESVYATQQQQGSSVQSTITGVRRVAVPTMFGLLTTVAAFYPLSMVDGRLGALFSQFAYVCTACLLFSLVESKLILPAHLRNLDIRPKSRTSRPGRWLARVQQAADRAMASLNARVYRPMIARALHYRYAVLSLFVSVFVLVVGMVPSGKVGFHFFPDIPEQMVTVSYSVEQGMGYAPAHEQAARVESVVEHLNGQWREQYPGNPDVITRRYSLVADDLSGTVTMELSPRDQRTLDATEVAKILDSALTRVEGLKEIVVLADDRIDKDFALNLLSHDATALARATDLVLATLTSLDGVEDIDNNLRVGQPQLVFELTPTGRALGMTTESLARQIQQSFYGAEVQRLQRGQDEVRVRVRYPADQRRDITDLQQARVRTPDGSTVALETVATVSSGYTVNEINRIDGIRAATLTANIDESLIEADDVYETLETSVFPQLRAQYPQMQIIEDGDAAQESESMRSMMLILVFSLLLIYLLVAIPLKSYWQPLVIMSVIPFGIVGAILGHWAMGLAISILSINGILALSGVVVNDSLLLVSRFNDMTRAGMAVREALVEAGSQRMRAILLTSVTTCLGLLSLLGETSEQGQFLVPAATSLAFGICFATLVSLVLVPILLMITLDVLALLKPRRAASVRVPGMTISTQWDEPGDVPERVVTEPQSS